MTSKSLQRPWGSYKPGPSALPFQLLIRLGLSRGAIARWIRKHWTSKVQFVDAERHGIRFRLSVQNNATDGKLLTNSKVYDREELSALSRRTSGDQAVFLDIGANTGYYSLSLAHRGFDRILAIEPNPPTLELLRFNVSANSFSNIEIVPLCVGESGTVRLHSTGDLGSTSTIAAGTGTSAIEVESQPLLQILTDRNISSVTSLKIDVEGAECVALLPFFAQAPHSLWPQTIVMEDCHQDSWELDLVQFLLKRSYAVTTRTRGNVILERRCLRQAA